VRAALALTIVASVLLLVRPGAAERYVANWNGNIVTLQDTVADITVSIAPGVGNLVFQIKVKGQDVLRWPYASVEEFSSRPGAAGIPFLAPWANRLDDTAFYANGKKYAFDMTLGNVRGPIPIHGLLQAARSWQFGGIAADAKAASVTSRLDFFQDPVWMKQWPFAHTIEMRHELADGMLELRTTIKNLSAEPMPVSIGFHPYVKLTDSTRGEWTIAVPAKTHWLLAPSKLPTGEREAVTRMFPRPDAASLKEYNLDDVFSDLQRDAQGRSTVTVRGKSQRLDVTLGPKFRALVIYSPSGRDFICFEPMAAITNALNLAQRGAYDELQSVPPGGTWQESFWIKPSGFVRPEKTPGVRQH
jgi:aldose 1-epimerase